MKALLMLATLISLSMIGVEVLSPLLIEGGACNLLSPKQAAFFWVASIFSLGSLSYRIGRSDGNRETRP